MFHSLNGRFDDAPRQDNVSLFFSGLSYSLHLHSSTHTPQSIWIYICSQSRSGAITFLYWAWFLDNSVWRWWVSKTSNWIETRDIVIQIHVFNINLTEKRAPKIARFLLKQWHKFCQCYQLFCQTKKKRTPIEEFQPWTKWYQTIFKPAPTIYTSPVPNWCCQSYSSLALWQDGKKFH